MLLITLVDHEGNEILELAYDEKKFKDKQIFDVKVPFIIKGLSKMVINHIN